MKTKELKTIRKSRRRKLSFFRILCLLLLSCTIILFIRIISKELTPPTETPTETPTEILTTTEPPTPFNEGEDSSNTDSVLVEGFIFFLCFTGIIFIASIYFYQWLLGKMSSRLNNFSTDTQDNTNNEQQFENDNFITNVFLLIGFMISLLYTIVARTNLDKYKSYFITFLLFLVFFLGLYIVKRVKVLRNIEKYDTMKNHQLSI